MAVIVFPDPYYVGIILSRSSSSDDGMDNLPLGFMTPEGADAAAQKRKGTVDQWCRDNMRRENGEPQFKTLENEAMGGFRLLDNVKRVSRFNSSMKWRIEDPRGFELEISSDNLMHIIDTTVIDQGEILDACLWARNGADNFLVPVSSDLYKETLATTEMSKRSISIRDMKPGDQVWLKNGSRGRYLGNLNYVRRTWSRDGKSNKHVFERAHFFNIDGTVLKQKTPKIGEIIPGELISHEDALAIANKNVPYDIVKFMPQKGKLTTRPASVPLLAEPKWRKALVGRRPSGEYVYLASTPYNFGKSTIQASCIESEPWEKDNKIAFKENRPNSSWWRDPYIYLTLNDVETNMCEWYVVRTELLCDGEHVEFF